MRHAGAPKREHRPLLAVATAGAIAVVAGFSVGSITGQGSALPSAGAAQPSIGASVADASPARSVARPAVDSAAGTSTVKPVEPQPQLPAPPEPQTVDAESPDSRASDAQWGEPFIDPEWPMDEKGDGCAAPVWPAASPDADRVLLVGDSLFRNARGLLEESLAAAGWVPTVRCWGAKGTDWGAAQVERARELGQLPSTVVVSLGTNDVWWLHIPMEDAVDQMMASLGTERDVYWINLWFNQSAYDDLPDPVIANEILDRKAEEYPNLHVIDFAQAFDGLASAGLDVGWTDGVHLNDTANQLRVDLIIAALSREG